MAALIYSCKQRLRRPSKRSTRSGCQSDINVPDTGPRPLREKAARAKASLTTRHGARCDTRRVAQCELPAKGSPNASPALAAAHMHTCASYQRPARGLFAGTHINPLVNEFALVARRRDAYRTELEHGSHRLHLIHPERPARLARPKQLTRIPALMELRRLRRILGAVPQRRRRVPMNQASSMFHLRIYLY